MKMKKYRINAIPRVGLASWIEFKGKVQVGELGKALEKDSPV